MPDKPLLLIGCPILAVAGWLVAGFLFGPQAVAWRAGGVVVAICVGVLVILVVRKAPATLPIAAGLLLCAALFFTVVFLVTGNNGGDPAPFGIPMGFTILGIIAAALVVVVVLFYTSLRIHLVEPALSKDDHSLTRRNGFVALIVAILLLIETYVALFWLIVWDSTYDPIGLIWLILLLLVAFAAGVGLIILLPGRLRLAGTLLALIIPAGLIAVTVAAQQVDFRDLTAARAARVAQALDDYRDRNGSYPERLEQLIPRDLLYLPKPVIIFGQSWCYDSDSESYRLGYVNREHWSDPRLVERIAQATGKGATKERLCAAEIRAMVKRHPNFFVAASEP